MSPQDDRRRTAHDPGLHCQFFINPFPRQSAEDTRLGVIQPQWALMACAVWD